MEGHLTWPLHVIWRGLHPHEVCAVIQLLPLKNGFVALPLRFDPLCIVIKVLEVVPMHLLIKIVQDRVPQGVLFLYEVPSACIQLHVSGHRSGEGFNFPSSDVKGDRNVVQVCSVSILFPPLSPKICWVPRAKVTQLNQGSRGGSTKGGRCSASRSQFALSLLKSLQEMRPAPSLGLTLRVLPWSLSSLLGRGSLVLGGESSSTAYGGGLVLQLPWSLHHFEDGFSPNPREMGGKNWGLYLLLIGSSQLLLIGCRVLLPDRGLHSGVGGHLVGIHWRVSCSGKRWLADSSHKSQRSLAECQGLMGMSGGSCSQSLPGWGMTPCTYLATSPHCEWVEAESAGFDSSHPLKLGGGRMTGPPFQLIERWVAA